MYHVVYLTTNLINNKIYVGIHSTKNLEDGYIGSGFLLRKAIKKYNKTNFKFQILYYCLDEEETQSWESKIVDASFLKRNDVYNLKLGGGNKVKFTEETKQKIRENKQEE